MNSRLLLRPLFWTASLIFNLRQPPFDDLRVRRAFAFATDRERWANSALSGLHSPATGGLVPPGMPGHSADIALPFDPEKARRLLADDGYPGGKGIPELIFIGPYWAEWGTRQEEFLTSLWYEILGARVSFEWLNMPEISRRLALRTHHMYVSGWSADYADPDNYLRLAVRVLQDGWENTHYEQLVEGARRTTSQEQRLQLYRSAENILLEEVPLLPVYYRRDLGLLKPWVKRAPYLPMHEEVWFWEDIILEPH